MTPNLAPGAAIVGAWMLWAASWLAASVWTRRTAARASYAMELPSRLVSLIGGLVLFFSLAAPRSWLGLDWRIGEAIGWLLFAAVLAGIGFAWWARLHLGALWSGTVTRKQDHRIVDTGPYAIVRHPIYSGILFSLFATAAQRGRLEPFVGAALLSVGLWMKARLEESFLGDDLGYGAYRERVPMLIPFAKKAARMSVTPSAAIVAAWLVWLVSWIMAAGWSARVASHHDLGAESPSRVLTLAAIVMMMTAFWPVNWGVIWITPAQSGWLLFGVALAGFVLAWAARLHLGPLWSSTAAPTEDHRIVDTGPYAIVRHPVYAGILLATWATALALGRVEALAGAVAATASLSYRAKLEERFLRHDLGDAAYASYRARVPMLIPLAKIAPRQEAK